ncbi:MAG: hypothetical protein ACOYEV_05750 [Candidatus Nanopelagicales bacterium]
MGLFSHLHNEDADHSEEHAETAREVAADLAEQAQDAPESLIWAPPTRGDLEKGL